MLEDNEKIKDDYSENGIKVLHGLEGVRKRPGMYIGSTSEGGLHHLVYEIVDNSVDEAMAGYCKKIEVVIEKDGSIRVKDDGRGIPVYLMEEENKTALEAVFTILHAGGKFDNNEYKVAGGLHGVGAAVVNALSNKLWVKVYRDNNIYYQEYEKGETKTEVKIIGKYEGDSTGTEVGFYPDDTIFNTTIYDYKILKNRLRKTAFLTKGLEISLEDKREGQEQKEVFKYDGGIEEFIQFLNEGKEVNYNKIFYCEAEKNDVKVEVAFQHNNKEAENILSFVNNIETPEGGTHLTGFKNALTKVVNDYAKEKKYIKESEDNLLGDDIREGLTAVVSVKVQDPQFEGQTKQKLGNSEVQNIVQSILLEKIIVFLEQNPDVGKTIFDYANNAKKGREAAKRAKEAVKRRTALEKGGGLPGKLVDCTEKNDISKCEIFIVEGDSALGPAKDGRDSRYQAVMPLRGKVLNVQKANEEHIYKNEEISGMITAFGTGVNENFNIEKLRYDKIIIMTDADVDGAHIATLMLTFIYNFMPELIKQGHVYLAQPPLFKVSKGKKFEYVYTEEKRDELLKTWGEDCEVYRFKGLGEMDTEQLSETTMDPSTRVLLKVNMKEDAKSEVDLTFSTLMGEEVEPRRLFIEQNAKFVTNLDI